MEETDDDEKEDNGAEKVDRCTPFACARRHGSCFRNGMVCNFGVNVKLNVVSDVAHGRTWITSHQRTSLEPSRVRLPLGSTLS
jgi:hypothetical protein